jgi:hypothetical protein
MTSTGKRSAIGIDPHGWTRRRGRVPTEVGVPVASTASEVEVTWDRELVVTRFLDAPPLTRTRRLIRGGIDQMETL